MKRQNTFPLDITEQPHVLVTMRDGCRLSARLWMPVDAADNPVPAILEHLPYRKRDGTVHRDELTHPWMAGHGYACIRVDMRGSGESEGLLEDEYTSQELQDACDVIAWLREQPWCDGNVGMMGISWGGFNSLQVAALQPEGLKAIITLCSTVDRFADDIHYKGGCLLNENIGWAANMLSYSSPPPDPVLVGDDWKSMWLDRLENQPFLASIWLHEQRRSAYWQHGSVCEDYDAIRAAVLSIGGWHDGYRNTISHLVENLSAPVKGIVGPWIHKYPHYAEPQPAIGFLQEALRWWDHWLKDKDTGVQDDPAYRVWLMDSVKPQRWLDSRPGRWIAEQQLPSPDITPLNLYLTQDSVASEKSNVAGALSNVPSQLHDVVIASPQDCGGNTGEYFPFTFGPELPDDQTADDLKSICFDGDLLNDAIDIVGAPQVQLTVSADQAMAFIVARLCDLRPDGSSALITMGVLNLTHRQSAENPTHLEPQATYDVTLILDQIAYRIDKGHRLRLSLSNSYWPFLWPSPVAVKISLNAGQLQLPKRSSAPSLRVEFEPPVAAAGWQEETLRKSSSTRKTIHDESTGEVTTLIENDFGENRDLQHGLLSGSKATERWSVKPDDPLSARAQIDWQQTGGRDDWHWRTDAAVTMHSDADWIYVQARLTVQDDDKVIFDRHYEDKIERRFV